MPLFHKGDIVQLKEDIKFSGIENSIKYIIKDVVQPKEFRGRIEYEYLISPYKRDYSFTFLYAEHSLSISNL
jgi:hypothetical protein